MPAVLKFMDGSTLSGACGHLTCPPPAHRKGLSCCDMLQHASGGWAWGRSFVQNHKSRVKSHQKLMPYSSQMHPMFLVLENFQFG